MSETNSSTETGTKECVSQEAQKESDSICLLLTALIIAFGFYLGQGE